MELEGNKKGDGQIGMGWCLVLLHKYYNFSTLFEEV